MGGFLMNREDEESFRGLGAAQELKADVDNEYISSDNEKEELILQSLRV